MIEKNDGGSAFPVHGGHPGDDPRNQILGGGMSLRDWFAGQALAGIMANPKSWLDDDKVLRAGDAAYRYADAMLAAREGRK